MPEVQEIPVIPTPPQPVEAPKPPERIIPRIQQFTEELGIEPDKLSPESKKLFDDLADESREMSDDERIQSFKKYSESLQRDPAVGEETKNFLKTSQETIDKHLKDGTMTKENILEGIKGMVNSPEMKLDDLQRKLTEDSLEEMKQIAENPEGSDGQKESRLKEVFNKVPKPVKLIFLAILAMFGLTIFKAFKSSSGGQMGRAA